MKFLKVFLPLLILISLKTHSQTNSYSDGWKDGYKQGYCYQINGCVAPIAPVAPVSRAGKDSYQDGYNRGFTKGKSDNKRNGSSSDGGAYGQLKPLKNTNTGSIVQEHIRRNKQSSRNRKSTKQKKINTELSFEESKSQINGLLSIDEILSFQNKSLVFVEEFLTTNNWELQGGNENEISFIKEKGIDTMMLTFYYNDLKKVTSLVVILLSKIKYASYLNEIKSLGCTIISSKVENNEISKIYGNNDNEFHISITKKDPKTNVSLYSIFVK